MMRRLVFTSSVRKLEIWRAHIQIFNMEQAIRRDKTSHTRVGKNSGYKDFKLVASALMIPHQTGICPYGNMSPYIRRKWQTFLVIFKKEHEHDFHHFMSAEMYTKPFWKKDLLLTERICSLGIDSNEQAKQRHFGRVASPVSVFFPCNGVWCYKLISETLQHFWKQVQAVALHQP